MTFYRTCHNCAIDAGECLTRKALRAALAGMHVTSVKHRCPDRAPLFHPGDRATVTWTINEREAHPDYEGGASDPEDWAEHTWPATVIREKGGKFIICVDDVDSDGEFPAREWLKNDSRYAKVAAGKLKLLDEPRRTVCARCENLEGNLTGCWEAASRADGYDWCKPDPKCLVNILAAQEPSQ